MKTTHRLPRFADPGVTWRQWFRQQRAVDRELAREVERWRAIEAEMAAVIREALQAFARKRGHEVSDALVDALAGAGHSLVSMRASLRGTSVLIEKRAARRAELVAQYGREALIKAGARPSDLQEPSSPSKRAA